MNDPSCILFENKKLVPSKRSLKDWKKEVPAFIRNYMFFISGVDDMEVLQCMYLLVKEALDEGWSVGKFVDEGLQKLDTFDRSRVCSLYDIERLRCIYLTQMSLLSGYRNFVDAFDHYFLQMYPAWEFFRQAGALTKRPDHVKNEGQIHLKTDLDFWISMNDENDGGFGNPYSPFGFNSWMTTLGVERDEAEAMGIIAPGERLYLSPANREKWGLPLLTDDDFNDPERLKVVKELKKWGVWEIREKILNSFKPPKKKPEPEPEPDPEPELDPEIQAWVNEELERLNKMTDEEILAELLGSEKQQ